ncbi:PqqD family peptide modification chaperone [Microbacterium sp.]
MHDDAAYLARLPQGPVIVLEGAAGLIWEELVATDDVTGLTERVRARLHDAPVDLSEQIDAFTAELLAAGWLARTDSSAS